MRVWPVAARYAWMRAWANDASRNRAPRDETPLRTIYNSWTCQFEDMPLSEFQQLLQQGRIQETVSRRPGRPDRYVYRLV